jgi:ribosome-associated translation inhibitor RaiA
LKVTVSSRTTSIDGTMREEVRGRIHFALSRYGPRIGQVTVQIADGGGPRGGSQRLWLCRLSVRMKQHGSFSIESVQDEVATAVSRAADRAAKQVQRILDRLRDETPRANERENP